MTKKEDIFVMNLRGSLDSVTAPDFIRYIESKKEDGYYRFLLTCDSLDYITSGGISSLVRLNQQDTVKYALVDLNREITVLFELLGIYNKLPVFNSRREAEDYLARFETPRQPEEFTGKGFSFQEPDRSGQLEIEENETKIPVKTKPEAPGAAPAKKAEAMPEKIVHYAENPLSENDEKSKIKSKNVFMEKVISCEACGNLLRIKQEGRHKCPGCSVEFDVRAGGSITYLEKLMQ